MANAKKGGASWGFVIVVSLILLIVGFIVFAPLVNLIINFISGGGSASVCTLSLFEGKAIAKCPVDDVTIYQDKVEIKYGEQKDYELLAKKKTTTNEMANEALAKLLYTCLQRGGGLNSRAFSRSYLFRQDIVCIECAQITIDNSVPSTITGLETYLNNNKPKGGISDKTYIDLLTRNEQDKNAYFDFGTRTKIVPPTTAGFAPGNDYVTFYVGLKKGSFDNWWGKFTGVISGDWIKAVLANSDAYYTYIGVPSKLGTVCERKVN